MNRDKVASELVRLAKELVAVDPSVVYEFGRGAKTPWGKAEVRYDIKPGVAFYETPSHGGLGIGRNVAKNYLSPAAQKIGERSGSILWFEEDVAIAAPLYENPDWASKIGVRVNKSSLEKELRTYYPEYFEDSDVGPFDLRSLQTGDRIFFGNNFSFPDAIVIGYRGRSLLIEDGNGKTWRLSESQFDWSAERVERKGKIIYKKR
jgi:hypothetical protein